jgi:CRP-like cAMP-binding protein
MWRRNHHTRNFTDQLRGTTLFGDCSERELRLIASLLTEVWLTAGRVLTRQGHVGNECFIILSGHAVVEHNGALVGHAVAGSVVGELALMGEITRTATVTAATDLQVLVMSRTEFATLRGLGIHSIDSRLEAVAADHRAGLARATANAASSSPTASTPTASISAGRT